MKTQKSECNHSPSGEHQFSNLNYDRDDQGFYLKCMHCNNDVMFECDTEEEFNALFMDGYEED